MRIRTFLLALALTGPSAFAQIAPAPQSTSSAVMDDEDILGTPKAFREFVVKATLPYQGYTMKTRALVRAVFSKPEDGGLGMVYANDKTRTVSEVWKDRKANCLSLTAFYVAACRAIQVDVKFADSEGINHWVRQGDLILHERHVVAVLPINPIDTMVADFSAEPRMGAHRIVFLSEERFKALYHSNRAVELLQAGQTGEAMREAEASLREDSRSGIGWNIYGVMLKASGQAVKAEAAFRKALEVDPKDGAACGNLEELCRSQGRDSEAVAFRDLGLRLRDRDPYFHAFIAKENLAAGKVDDALAQIQRALKLQRMEPDFYLILAQAELNRGEHNAATKAVQKAIHWSLPDQRKRMESKLALIQSQT
ncbi:MAG TPA: tetratricopeptide repeat protein [Holophagaceae bacterium]|jgi:tetratricopeptide (TPR) repeat protein|nr:tetratricopeptide repeat protein [Holophagaceae bacterium]